MPPLTQATRRSWRSTRSHGRVQPSDSISDAHLWQINALPLPPALGDVDGRSKLAAAAPPPPYRIAGAMVLLWSNNATEAGKQTVRDATKDCGRSVYI